MAGRRERKPHAYDACGQSHEKRGTPARRALRGQTSLPQSASEKPQSAGWAPPPLCRRIEFMRIEISRAGKAGQPLIAFGVNSAFALNHLLGHTLIGLAGKGYHMAAIAPHAEDEFLHVAACPDLLLENIAMKREIAPLADLLVL